MLECRAYVWMYYGVVVSELVKKMDGSQVEGASGQDQQGGADGCCWICEGIECGGGTESSFKILLSDMT